MHNTIRKTASVLSTALLLFSSDASLHTPIHAESALSAFQARENLHLLLTSARFHDIMIVKELEN